MRGTTRALIAIGLALMLVAAGGGAQGSVEPRVSPVLGPDFRVSGHGAVANEYNPELAWNGKAGEYLVVWQDDRNKATRGRDIFGRRVDADGTRLGGDFRVSGGMALADEWDPAVAWNATAEEYLVVWADSRNAVEGGPYESDVYGRRFSAEGLPIGGDFLVGSLVYGSGQDNTAVAWNAADNEYLVVWGDTRDEAARGYDIYAQRVSPAGAPVGADFRVSGQNALADEWYPEVAWNAVSGEYLVVWQDARSLATRGLDVYGRRVGADGKTIGGDFRIGGRTALNFEEDPMVACGPGSGECLVVWYDNRNSQSRGSDIFARRLAADGTRLGRDFRISGPLAIGADNYPSVAWNDTAQVYLVVWADGRDEAARGMDIFGRRVAADGTRVGRDFRISGPKATAEDILPALAWNGDGNEYLAVWVDRRNFATSNLDIYGRRVDG